jgi:hypothetical protein
MEGVFRVWNNDGEPLIKGSFKIRGMPKVGCHPVSEKWPVVRRSNGERFECCPCRLTDKSNYNYLREILKQWSEDDLAWLSSQRVVCDAAML